MSLLRNIGRTAIFKVLAQAGLLGGVMYFTRRMSPEVLGTYFYFLSIVGVVGLVSAFGIAGSAEKFVSEGDAASEWYSTGLFGLVTLSLCAGIGIGALLFVYPPSFVDFTLDGKFFPYFVVVLITGRVFTYYQHMFRAELRAATAGLLDFCRVFVFLISSVAVLQVLFSPISLIIGTIAAYVTTIGISAYLTDLHIRTPSFGRFRELLSFSKYYFLVVIGSKVFYLTDIVLIGHFLTTADVGRYDVAWRLIMSGIIINGVIATTLFSYVSKAEAFEDQQQIKDDLQTALKYVLIIPIGMVGGAFLIGTDLIELLFTSEYVAETYLIGILAAGFVFQALYFLFSRSLVAMDQPRKAFVGTVLSVTVNVVLNVYLIPRHGVYGAAVATSSSFAVAAVLYFLLVYATVRVSLPVDRVAVQVGSTAVMLVVIYGASTVTGQTGVAVLLLTLLGGLTYVGVLSFVPRTRTDLRVLLEDVRDG